MEHMNTDELCNCCQVTSATTSTILRPQLQSCTHTHTHTRHVFNQLTSGPYSRYLAARKLTFACVAGTLGCHPGEAYQDLIVIGNRMEVVIKSGLESRTLGWLA